MRGRGVHHVAVTLANHRGGFQEAMEGTRAGSPDPHHIAGELKLEDRGFMFLFFRICVVRHFVLFGYCSHRGWVNDIRCNGLGGGAIPIHPLLFSGRR